MDNVVDGVVLLTFDWNLTPFIDTIIAQFETMIIFVTVQ